VIGSQGRVVEAWEVAGFHPGPRPGALPLDPAKGGGPWNHSFWLGNGRGPTQTLISAMAIPLPFPNQWTDCKGPRPLLEVQEAKPPGGFEGRALALPRLRHLP
jgi:hypothetical protein